jgi:hypothetical protein
MDLNRRSFLFGASAVIAAPAVVRAASLMPVKALPTGANAVWLDSDGMNWSVRAAENLYCGDLVSVDDAGLAWRALDGGRIDGAYLTLQHAKHGTSILVRNVGAGNVTIAIPGERHVLLVSGNP